MFKLHQQGVLLLLLSFLFLFVARIVTIVSVNTFMIRSGSTSHIFHHRIITKRTIQHYNNYNPYRISFTHKIMMMMSSSSNNDSSSTNDRIVLYNIPNSGWKSEEWNWGSAIGTGHDCAKICRLQYNTKQQRMDLIQNLLHAHGNDTIDIPNNFEEVKLVLALTWQLRGRWDRSNGGIGGYNDILQHLIIGQRYETTNNKNKNKNSNVIEEEVMEWSIRWICDMAIRYTKLQPTKDQMKQMECCYQDAITYHNSSHNNTSNDKSSNMISIYRARRQCSGLVLQAMGFIDNGC